MLARLQADQAVARKAQNKARVLLLGMVISEVKNREIEQRRDANNDDTLDVLRKGIKRRRESAEMYRKGGRADLADNEQAEAEALTAYLPPQVDPEDIRVAVARAIADGAVNVGAVMARVMPAFKGRADGTTINAIAREELARL